MSVSETAAGLVINEGGGGMSETPAPAPGAPIHTSEDEQALHKMGYAQELFRSMGGFQNFAISFTIISILAGCLTSYFIAFQWGGPVAVTWGWLLVGTMSTVVALGMAEIASAYPTAGGLYYWASKLGSPAWGWFTGWFNLIGQIAVTAAIAYGLAIFGTSLFNLLFDYPNTREYIFLFFSVVMLVATLFNLFNVRITAGLNTISAYWHMIGVVIIVAALIIVPDQHQSAGYVFGETINNSGFSGTGWSSITFWFVFGIGLTMSQYTITGYDASAHMAEETHQASRSAAIGMVSAVIVSVFFGFILLVAVTFAIPETQGALDAAGNIVTYVWQESMSTRWAEFLLIIACTAQLFCLCASTTSASRMMFAFSRDGAVPGHQLWRHVSRHRVPSNAVIAIGVLAWALMIPTYWNNLAGYYVGTSIAVIGLYIAFILPVILRWRMGDKFEHGAWSLGKHYKWIDPLATIWVAFISIIFLMPTVPGAMPWNEAWDWNLANYAPLTVGGAFILFGGWYVLSAHKWFKGPVRMGTEEELELLEAQQESEFALPADSQYKD
jgi:amino acid transporter